MTDTSTTVTGGETKPNWVSSLWVSKTPFKDIKESDVGKGAKFILNVLAFAYIPFKVTLWVLKLGWAINKLATAMIIVAMAVIGIWYPQYITKYMPNIPDVPVKFQMPVVSKNAPVVSKTEDSNPVESQVVKPAKEKFVPRFMKVTPTWTVHKCTVVPVKQFIWFGDDQVAFRGTGLSGHLDLDDRELVFDLRNSRTDDRFDGKVYSIGIREVKDGVYKFTSPVVKGVANTNTNRLTFEFKGKIEGRG